jgi:hypothetical protein
MLAAVNMTTDSGEVRVTQWAYIQECAFQILTGTPGILNEVFVIFLNLSSQIPE